MKKIFFKGAFYSLLIVLVLELVIRGFHLTKDYPIRIIDKNQVEKWKPNQNGYSVTGNRRQNFSEFRINNSGFNSYREFTPSKEKKEIALVGDSYIEGFHQDYRFSIGNKIEKQLTGFEVYEYAYAGYDFADELNLISKYKDKFNLIDYVFIDLKFNTDLQRGVYAVIPDRMNLETPFYRNLRKFKLLVYLNSIGVTGDLKTRFRELIALKIKPDITPSNENKLKEVDEINPKYLANFNTLVETYNFDKSRFVLLLEKRNTPNAFKNYLKANNFKFIDLSSDLEKSKTPTTLIYDSHWNDKGRSIVANAIVKYTRQLEFNY
ncbi:hypothetical protein [Algibacter pectinivorans]|uniref:SGNH/GDSL hydrolase family protein n=1 Tax=Algibacter pectinivorans TaxID=870482 RepID=A0A1I1PBZ2_9FLAO|nr:hypothetical protein [Algibacter pectinivorans]SFD07357.1 hypothetical protein SAMN04487987_103373 [Algibacter pectinivorans]